MLELLKRALGDYDELTDRNTRPSGSTLVSKQRDEARAKTTCAWLTKGFQWHQGLLPMIFLPIEDVSAYKINC